MCTLTLNTKITDDPEPVYADWAKDKGITIKEAKNIPTVLIGSDDEIKEQLFNFREATGINYIVLGEPNIEEIREFGEHIVKDMAGK